MPNWPEPWLRKVGGKLPTRYVAFDTETSGFGKADQIVSIAHVQVCDKKVEHVMCAYIDWRGVPWVDLNALRRGLDKVQRDLPGYTVTWEKLCDIGLPALEVFDAYHHIFTTLVKKGYYGVAHNPYRFDEPRLATAMRNLRIAQDFNFGNQLIDLHALEIVSRDSSDPALIYQKTDTFREWNKRVMNNSGKFKECRLMENLVPKYGIVLDFDRIHDADIGAIACHHLLDHFAPICAHRHEALHPTQWVVEPENPTRSRPPLSKSPIPHQQPGVLQVNAGSKRFRGQRSR